MSHFDWIVNSLAVIGFFSLCCAFVLCAFMVKSALEARKPQKKTLTELKDKWHALPVEAR